MLRVSALHYSARDRISEGFRTVASAHALRQPTSCGSKYFYSQCPQVWNLIGTEHSLNRGECRVKSKAKLRVIPINLISDFRVISSIWKLDYRSQSDVGSDQRSSRQGEQ